MAKRSSTNNNFAPSSSAPASSFVLFHRKIAPRSNTRKRSLLPFYAAQHKSMKFSLPEKMQVVNHQFATCKSISSMGTSHNESELITTKAVSSTDLVFRHMLNITADGRRLQQKLNWYVMLCKRQHFGGIKMDRKAEKVQ